MPWTYRVYIDTSTNPSAANMGHAYIQITSPSGEVITRGYYPVVTQGTGSSSLGGHIVSGPGIVKDDAATGITDTGERTQHSYDYATLPREISEATANRMLEHIEHVTQNPGEYGILGNNCVEFVEDLLDIAGDRGWWRDYVAPISLSVDLKVAEQWREFLDRVRGLPGEISDFFRQAQRPPPRDPLAIDLDGDGIETLGIPTNGTSPILFDHNADGVRTGTGWLRPDDAWLVLDRNGNGTIDSGRELFGVDTVITRTITSPLTGTYSFETTAATGFEALRALDANGDRVLNAADAAFTQVRLWQDTNQNGVSDAGELATLAERGITGIGLTETAATTNLGNGNTVTGTATVTRSNGSRNLRPKRRRAAQREMHFGTFVPLIWMRERGSLRGLAQRGSCARCDNKRPDPNTLRCDNS